MRLPCCRAVLLDRNVANGSVWATQQVNRGGGTYRGTEQEERVGDGPGRQPERPWQDQPSPNIC